MIEMMEVAIAECIERESKIERNENGKVIEEMPIET
jgi:hypothetical protein